MEKDVVLNLHLSEDDTNTLAFATLDLRGDHFEALGSAKRNPIDPPMPVVGEELAIARALAVLQQKVTDAATTKIEQFLR
jgi:hypothetical protein